MTTTAKILICLAGCALMCTAVNLVYFPLATTFSDEQRFISSALRLAETGQFWVGPDRAWEMPGTAAFFSVFFKIGGPRTGILLIRFAQTALLLVQVGLMTTLAWQIFRTRSAALLTAAMGSCYPFFVYYQGLLLSETLFTTALVGAVVALYWWRERGTRIDASLILTCLLFGLAAWIKPTLTLLPPFLIAASSLTARSDLAQTAKILVVASAAFCATLSPWWVRNYVVLGAFVPATTSSASNLYAGNNANNPDFGVDWQSRVDRVFVAETDSLTDELERQKRYKEKATDWIKHNPALFLKGIVVKFLRLWNVVPNATEFRNASFVAISLFSFGPVLCLAIVSAWMARRRFFLFPLYALIAYVTLVYAITIASLRYRFPLEPFLIVMASYPLSLIWDKWTHKAVA